METNPDILGYIQQENGSLTPLIQPKGYIYTRAFIMCKECGSSISGDGGPRYDTICVNCYETVDSIHTHME